jgi:hypothetical protein
LVGPWTQQASTSWMLLAGNCWFSKNMALFIKIISWSGSSDCTSSSWFETCFSFSSSFSTITSPLSSFALNAAHRQCFVLNAAIILNSTM